MVSIHKSAFSNVAEHNPRKQGLKLFEGRSYEAFLDKMKESLKGDGHEIKLYEEH